MKPLFILWLFIGQPFLAGDVTYTAGWIYPKIAFSRTTCEIIKGMELRRVATDAECRLTTDPPPGYVAQVIER